MKNITITNAYSYDNKGDAGILLGTIDVLKKIYGKNIKVNILTFTKELDKDKYKEEKCINYVENNILNPRPYSHTKIGKLYAIFKLLIRTIYLYTGLIFFKKYIVKKEKSLKILQDSDLIIVCGGGFLGGKKKHSIIHLIQMDINTKFNKKVIMMGTSIEPLKDKKLDFLTKKILKKLNFIIAREEITYNYLKTFMKETKIKLLPDMAFMLKDKKSKFNIIENFKKNYKYIIGITVRKWNFPNSNNIIESEEKYYNAIKELIINYSRKNIGFVFIPQVIIKDGNDILVAQHIKNMLPEDVQHNFLIVDSDYSPSKIKSLIGNMDYFLGTRMHSNIFSISMGVPTIAIKYEEKTQGIMDMVNLGDFVVDINNINEKEINKLFKKLEKEKETIKLSMKFSLKAIRKEIYENISEILKRI